jgi:hypothetical protein
LIDRVEERLGNILRRLFRKPKPQSGRAICPDEESLANYLSGLLSGAAKESLEVHIASCSFCVDEIVAAHKTMQDTATEAVPQRVIDRAMRLVPAKQRNEGVFDLVVRLVKDSIELVSTSGQWITPLSAAPVGVRGRAQPSESSILQVEKEMGKFKVAVEVERIETDLCQVVVNVSGLEGKAADAVRVSLLAGGREQASYVTRQGEAVFDRIPQGEYNLALSEAGAPVGMIRLKME